MIIKAENFVLDENFHVKLIDFGSAVIFNPSRAGSLKLDDDQ